MNPYDVRKILANANMAIINERADKLIADAENINDLLALVAAGGRASDMIALGSQAIGKLEGNADPQRGQ